MKQAGKILIGVLIALTLIWVFTSVVIAPAATYTESPRSITFTAADATPLDGKTAGQTYQFSDLNTSAAVILSDRADGVIVTAYGKGSDTNAGIVNIYGYADGAGPAQAIYDACTFTLGDGIAGTSLLYVETFSGTDCHASSGGVTVSDATNAAGRPCKLSFDTMGYKYLVFEVQSLTASGTITSVTFQVQEIGYR